MSAALLRNKDQCNELEDDRESCLHVLTWMALSFTDHTISGGSTSRFLRYFDEEYEDEGVKGGDLKRDSSQLVIYPVWSSSMVVPSWIRELTEAFAARYEEPPSADQLQALERAQAANIDPSIMSGLTAFNYQKHLDNLVARNWLVDVFRRYLDTDPWPPSDEAH